MDALKDKVAVITGGSRGFGLVTAQAYMREGAAVVVASRGAAAVEKAVTQLKQNGRQASGIACDVSDRAQVEALAEHAIQTFGRIDIWVNNAALSAPYGPTVEVPVDYYERTLGANIHGTYYGSIVALRHMLPRRSGKLINILGTGDTGPRPMQTAYGASKSWVRAFTLALAKENEHNGVGVFAFNPGLMLTDMLSDVSAVAGYETRLKPLETVMRLWANPPDVPAGQMVWLASRATDGRTGIELHQLTKRAILSGVLREGWRRLRRGPDPIAPLHVTTVPSALPKDG